MSEVRGPQTYESRRLTAELEPGQTQLLHTDGGESFMNNNDIGSIGMRNANVTNIIHAGGEVFLVAEIGEHGFYSRDGALAIAEPGTYVIGTNTDAFREHGSTAMMQLRPGETFSLDSHANPGFDTFFGRPEDRPNVNLSFTLGEDGVSVANRGPESVAVDSPRRRGEPADAGAEVEPAQEVVAEEPAEAVEVVGGTALAAVAGGEHATKGVERHQPRASEIFRSARSVRETLASDEVDEDVRAELREVLGLWDQLCQAREVNAVWEEVVRPHLSELERALPDAEAGVRRVADEIRATSTALTTYINGYEFAELGGMIGQGMHAHMDEDTKWQVIGAGNTIVQHGRQTQAELNNPAFLDDLNSASRSIIGSTTEHHSRVRAALSNHGDVTRYTDDQLDALCARAQHRGEDMEQMAQRLRSEIENEPNAARWPQRQQALEGLSDLVGRVENGTGNVLRDAAARFGGALETLNAQINSGVLTAGNPGNYYYRMQEFTSAVATLEAVATADEVARLQATFASLRSELSTAGAL